MRLQQSEQVHDETLDELCVGAHQAVELRAIWQGGKSVAQTSRCVAVEVPLARETAPPSEDGLGLPRFRGLLAFKPRRLLSV